MADLQAAVGALVKSEFMSPVAEKPEKTADDLVAEIMRKHPKLTRIEVLQLMSDEIAKAAGLLTKEGALVLVAANLGVEPKASPTRSVVAEPLPPTSALNLVEGVKGATVSGKVLDDPTTTEKTTQRGPVDLTSFRIDTGTQIIRVSIWDNPKAAEGVSAGMTVTVENIDVKANYDGVTQVSGGKKTRIVGGRTQVTAPQKAYPDRNDGEWAEMKGGKGCWVWSNRAGELAGRIRVAGGKLTEGGYVYGFYGEDDKCISRYPDNRR